MPTQEQMTPSEQYWAYYEEKAPIPTELGFFALSFSGLIETISLNMFQKNSPHSAALLTNATEGAEYLETDMRENSGNTVENAVAAWTLLRLFGVVDKRTDFGQKEIYPVAEQLAIRQVAAVEKAKEDAKEVRKKAIVIHRLLSQAYAYLLNRQAELEQQKKRTEEAHKEMTALASTREAKKVTNTDEFVDATRKASSEFPKELSFVTKTIDRISSLLLNLNELVRSASNVTALESTVTIATIG